MLQLSSKLCFLAHGIASEPLALIFAMSTISIYSERRSCVAISYVAIELSEMGHT